MTLHAYINTIYKYCGKSQYDTIIKLFKAAGSVQEVIPETAQSWLKTGNGHRNCRIKDYFPNDTLNEDDFINFFESRINIKWKKMQKEFRSIDDDNIVDLDTDSEKEFYWSLLNQFQKIHNLPLSKKKNISNDASSCSNEMVRIFKECAEFYRIPYFITYDPALYMCYKELHMDDNLLQSTDWFIKEIQNNLIIPFESYKHDIIYIKISQFIFFLKEYKEYLNRNSSPLHWPDLDQMVLEKLGITNPSLNLNISSKSEAEKNMERYRSQLISIYNDVCNTSIDLNILYK